MEFDKFKATVRTSGATSLEITIPFSVCRFADIKLGDEVEVWIKKTEVNEK